MDNIKLLEVLNLIIQKTFVSVTPTELTEQLISKLTDYDRIKSENSMLRQKHLQLNSEILTLTEKVETLGQIKKRKKVYFDE